MGEESLAIRIGTVSWRDGIIRVRLEDGARVTREDARESIEAQRRLTGPGARVPVLVDIRGIDASDAETRAYLSGPEAARSNRAVALVVDSAVSKVIGNFFVGMNRPPFPARLFTDEEEAVRWLSQHGPA